MTETPFFFERDHARLFAVLHEPSAPARTPFVFCHPFAEEKLWTHRVFVTFARELARRGHPVLRFDYLGNGDSSGTFSDWTPSAATNDIESAIDLVKQRTGAERVNLLGLRLGASLAFKVAAGRPDVQTLVLWSPIVDGARYLQELLRINLTTQMAVYREIREDREQLSQVLEAGGTVNVDGYEITKAMARELAALSLTKESAVPSGPCLVAQIDRNPKAARERDLDALCGRLSDVQLTMIQEEPFWKEILRFYDTAPNLCGETLQWLEAR